MKLYVMRHGPAEDHAASGRDEDRALTARGRDRVREVVKLLAQEDELPGRVLASGLVRAQQTAEIVVAAAKGRGWSGDLETVPELAPGGRGMELVQTLIKTGAIAPVVVGHEPDLSSLVDRLLERAMPVPMDKAMVVALEVHADRAATLRFILDPKAPAMVHDARR